jgi:hypothetical protein
MSAAAPKHVPADKVGGRRVPHRARRASGGEEGTAVADVEAALATNASHMDLDDMVRAPNPPPPEISKSDVEKNPKAAPATYAPPPKPKVQNKAPHDVARNKSQIQQPRR